MKKLSTRRRREPEDAGAVFLSGEFRWRIALVGLLLLAGIGVLLVRLYFEQIHEGESHREQVERQSIRRIRIPAPRGRILSSDLRVLADNEPVFDVVFFLEEMRRPGKRQNTLDYAMKTARELASCFGLPDSVTEDALIRWINNSPGLPFPVFRAVNRTQLARFYEVAPRYLGVGVETRFERVYPEGDLAAVTLGYVRAEDPSSASDRREYSYYLPDWEGRSGAERSFDELNFADASEDLRGLRGFPGYSIVRVDNLGYIRQVLIDEIPPVAGNNLVLTLDARAQRIAQDLLKGQTGAMVVLNADTGEVLVLASSPGFTLDDFMPRISAERYRELLDDPERPLLNRALQGTYMPGSIIKPLIALAIQNAGVSPFEEVVCTGYTEIGNARIRCTGVHGAKNLETALQVSCNDYFTQMGMRIGLDEELKVLRSAGLGSAPELELSTARGQVPDREEFRRQEGRAWNAYNTALTSIGQGMITVSPLQAAVYTAALANSGRMMRPHLLKSVNDCSGRVLYEVKPEVTGHLAASQEAIGAVRRGMRLVVAGGSGRAADNQAIALSGKTGTAEVGPRGNRRKNTWFIGFGERNRNRYAIAVLVEDSSSGGRDCAPLAAKFFLEYLGVPKEPETALPLESVLNRNQ